MSEANWYVVHTYSGYENKVAANLEKIIIPEGVTTIEKEALDIAKILFPILYQIKYEIKKFLYHVFQL